MKHHVIGLILLSFLIGCEDQGTFREDVVMAGGNYVTADTLNLGKRIYTEYCMACHGKDGKGDGVASKGMSTPPRDFTLGIMKFGDVLSGELPHDGILKRHLKRGLNGTAMLPWDLAEGQMNAVLQYVKTFAPKTWIGKDKKLGEKVTLVKDPYGLARRSSAIEKGKGVYHVTANCQSCHRAYVSSEEIVRLTKEISGDSISVSDIDPSSFVSKPQESDHGYKTIPPDFTWDSVRSAESVEEIALRLAAGIGGTAMPAWKDTITDEEIWAVSYYVKSLMELKDSKKRRALIEGIK